MKNVYKKQNSNLTSNKKRPHVLKGFSFLRMRQEIKMNNKLWTRDFTIITLGSIISMFGSALSNFAMSLMVLDYTNSSLLYAIYIASFTLPQIFVPIFSGAMLDRFSRKKTIYTLDFVSAALYGVVAVILAKGWFSFPILAIFCVCIGTISAFYMVAYQSFYPMLISEGNYSKAYSISSVLETMTAVMVPASAFIYNWVGIVPLLVADAVSFFLAAVMETQIRSEEAYVTLQKNTYDNSKSRVGNVLADIKEGFRYLYTEKGLLAVAIYFTFTSLAGGAETVIGLPYFKENYANGEYVYMIVFVWIMVGRAIGGLIHYRFKLPTKLKFAIAMIVYASITLIGAVYLFLPVPMMMVCMLIMGLFGVTSYTIRISATQSYVPDEKKGRFNGAFNMLNTAGSFAGEMAAGALALVISQRHVVMVFYLVNFLAALVIIGGNRKHVGPLYNTEQ